MRAFLKRGLITAVGLGIAAYIIPGIRIDTIATLLFSALLLGAVNAVVRPVLFILTLPVTIITLGLFVLVINAAMLALVAAFIPGFMIDSFWAAFLGWIIVSITSWLISSGKE